MNYISFSWVPAYFTFFIGVWIYLRHYINLVILYATLTTFATVGPFELDWETQQYKCWISQYITFALLAALQSLNIFWLYFVLRVAYNIVFASSTADVRSDDEDSEVEVDEKSVKEGEKKLIEKGGFGSNSGLDEKTADGYSSNGKGVVEEKTER